MGGEMKGIEEAVQPEWRAEKKPWSQRVGRAVLPMSIVLFLAGPAMAQLTDKKQTPNNVGEGINKLMHEQDGAGRGDLTTWDSSLYIISRDPFRAIRRGRQLFQRKFTVEESLGPWTLDGVGDIDQDASIGGGGPGRQLRLLPWPAARRS